MKDHIRLRAMERESQAERPEPPVAWLTSGRDAQVFVDDSGRRALGMRAAGVAVAAMCAFWLAGLTVGMAGFSGFQTVGLRTLAHAGVARPVAPRRAADRSAIRLAQAPSPASRGPVADTEVSARGPSCLAFLAAPSGRPKGGSGRPVPRQLGLTTPRSVPPSAARLSCPDAGDSGSHRGVSSRLT
jgi:hypothetical protein